MKNRLTSEWLFRLVEDICRENGVNFNYCYLKMLKVKPGTRVELDDAMEQLLAWAYFNDYYALYGGIIPYRDCNPQRAILEAEEQDREATLRKPSNLN